MSETNKVEAPRKEIKSRQKKIIIKETKYNELGQRLNKDGSVDKRQFLGTKNLEKTTVYQTAKEAKKQRKNILDDPVESETESEEEVEEDEFELEELVVKPKGEPQVVEVEKIVVQEVLKDDPVKDLKLRKLEENNKILNDKFAQISHLTAMERLNRSISIKR